MYSIYEMSALNEETMAVLKREQESNWAQIEIAKREQQSNREQLEIARREQKANKDSLAELIREQQSNKDRVAALEMQAKPFPTGVVPKQKVPDAIINQQECPRGIVQEVTRIDDDGNKSRIVEFMYEETWCYDEPEGCHTHSYQYSVDDLPAGVAMQYALDKQNKVFPLNLETVKKEMQELRDRVKEVHDAFYKHEGRLTMQEQINELNKKVNGIHIHYNNGDKHP